MSEEYGKTDCPLCGKLVVVIANSTEWQYICTGTPEKPCGGAFEFKKKEDDVEE